MTLNDPFARLPKVPEFTLTSEDVADGQPLSPAQYSGLFGIPGGEDASPQLTWHGAPATTKSYAVTMYDPDAPTLSGFWHWAVANIPASTTTLATGAGDSEGTGLPEGAFQVPNDARMAQFIGAAPPAGDGPHRYFITVHALDVDTVELGPDGTPGALSFEITPHTVGRATLVPTGESPAS